MIDSLVFFHVVFNDIFKNERHPQEGVLGPLADLN